LLKAKIVASTLGAKQHKTVKIDLGVFGGSALTDDAIDVPDGSDDEIPVTYVPARNTVFLSMGLAWAEVIGAQAIFIGANAYPDCRPEYIKSYEQMANLATKSSVEGQPFKVIAPCSVD